MRRPADAAVRGARGAFAATSGVTLAAEGGVGAGVERGFRAARVRVGAVGEVAGRLAIPLPYQPDGAAAKSRTGGTPALDRARRLVQSLSVSSPPEARAEAPRERTEPRELAAMTALAAAQPELAPAIALERELLDGERRLQRRLGTPWLAVSNEELAGRLAAGRRLMDWHQLALDWPEVRLRLRQVVDVLRRHDVLETSDVEALVALGRGPQLPDTVQAWYDGADASGGVSPAMADVLAVATRPFLTRAAEVVQQRVSTESWQRGSCPICSGRPVFAVIPPTGDRQLVCGRCHSRWAFDPKTCPHCGVSGRLRAFSAHDGTYQVAACEACQRYVKALDVGKAGRPLFLPLDTVATLPLDQALAAQGFASE
jgi:Protein involved in formate dehydrogenase formation